MSAAHPVRPAVSQEIVPVTLGKGRWSSLTVMAFSFVVDNSESGLINTLFPMIRAALGLNLGALGLLVSISRFARMVFGPVWAMMADRYGRKRVLFIVTGVWGIWTALAGLSQNFTQLLILYSIGVIGTVASEPIANGLLADLFAEKERGKAYGAIRSISGFATLFFTALIGQFANIENGWRYGMLIMGGMSVLSGLLILLLVKEPERRTTRDDADVERVRLRDVAILFKTPTILLLAVNLLFVTSLVLLSFFVTYFVDVRGWQTAQAAILLTTFSAGFGISSLVGGLLGDYFDKRYGPKGRIILMQLYLVAFAVMSFLALQIDWGQGVMLYIILFFFGLVTAIGFSGCVLPMVAAVVPPQIASTAFAVLFSLIQGLILAVLSLALGYLAQTFGLQTVMLWMVTVPYAINAVFWFAFYRVYPRDVAAQQARMASHVSAL
jgi:MFS family permease